MSSPTSLPAPHLDIIVPCYNEVHVLPATIARLSALLERLREGNLVSPESRLLFVDDGSQDATWTLIADANARDARIGGIKLAANVGHQNALLAGLASTTADAAITIDCDLQDDIEVIPEMLALHRDGAEIVYGIRSDRSSDHPFKRHTARIFYGLMAAFGVTIVPDHADFRLMGRKSRDALLQFREVNLFLRGLVPLLGFRTASVTYTRLPRTAGESKYPLRRMIALAVDGVTSFSSVPLKMISRTGGLICVLSIFAGFWALAARLSGGAMPGWASTVVPLYFLGGLQMLSLGIIGEYLAKIYFETKARPRFIVETRL